MIDIFLLICSIKFKSIVEAQNFLQIVPQNDHSCLDHMHIFTYEGVVEVCQHIRVGKVPQPRQPSSYSLP